MVERGDGGAILGTGAAVDVASVAWDATENSVCDGVGQLSDPSEGHCQPDLTLRYWVPGKEVSRE